MSTESISLQKELLERFAGRPEGRFLRKYFHATENHDHNERVKTMMMMFLCSKPAVVPLSVNVCNLLEMHLPNIKFTLTGVHELILCEWAIKFAPNIVVLNHTWKRVMQTFSWGRQFWNERLREITRPPADDAEWTDWDYVPLEVQEMILDLACQPSD